MTNEQWNKIEPIIISSTPSKDPRGRHARDPLYVFIGILWSPLEGFATTVSAIPDVPSSIPAMGKARGFQAYC